MKIRKYLYGQNLLIKKNIQRYHTLRRKRGGRKTDRQRERKTENFFVFSSVLPQVSIKVRKTDIALSWQHLGKWKVHSK